MTKLNSTHFGKSILLASLLLAAVPLQAGDEQEAGTRQNYRSRHRRSTITAAIANADLNAEPLAKKKVDNSKTAAVPLLATDRSTKQDELTKHTQGGIAARIASLPLPKTTLPAEFPDLDAEKPTTPQQSKSGIQPLPDPIRDSDNRLPANDKSPAVQADKKAMTKEEIMRQLMKTSKL